MYINEATKRQTLDCSGRGLIHDVSAVRPSSGLKVSGDSVMVVVRFFVQGLCLGYYYCSLMALSWDPVMINWPIAFIQRPLMGSLLL